MGIPNFPLVPLTLGYYRLISGVDLDAMDMCVNLKAIQHIPTLVVHSKEDEKVPMESYECLKNSINPKISETLLFINGVHDSIYETNAKQYREKVGRFIVDHDRR